MSFAVYAVAIGRISTCPGCVVDGELTWANGWTGTKAGWGDRAVRWKDSSRERGGHTGPPHVRFVGLSPVAFVGPAGQGTPRDAGPPSVGGQRGSAPT